MKCWYATPACAIPLQAPKIMRTKMHINSMITMTIMAKIPLHQADHCRCCHCHFCCYCCCCRHHYCWWLKQCGIHCCAHAAAVQLSPSSASAWLSAAYTTMQACIKGGHKVAEKNSPSSCSRLFLEPYLLFNLQGAAKK